MKIVLGWSLFAILGFVMAVNALFMLLSPKAGLLTQKNFIQDPRDPREDDGTGQSTNFIDLAGGPTYPSDVKDLSVPPKTFTMRPRRAASNQGQEVKSPPG